MKHLLYINPYILYIYTYIYTILAFAFLIQKIEKKMPVYKHRNMDGIAGGYVRQVLNILAPNDVIKIISQFLDCLAVFNLYNSASKTCIKNIMYFTFSHGTRYYMNIDYELFVDGLNQYIDDRLFQHNYFNGNDIKLIRNSSINARHCFIYTKTHKLYGFGSNSDNQVYPSIMKSKITETQLISHNFDSILVQIGCGRWHSLFLTQIGTVFGCGASESGQLTDKYQSDLFEDNRQIHIQKILAGNNIISIDCCSRSSLAMDNNNTLQGFGKNDDGQLGIQKMDDILQDIWKPTKVLNGIKLNMFSCGHLHTGILTDNNILWMFGENGSHQCGYVGINLCHNGNTIKLNNELIISIKCGHSHNIIKTNKDNYYGFGCNNSNQLLIKNSNHDNIPIPTLISKEYLKELINCNNDIIDLIPVNEETFIVY